MKWEEKLGALQALCAVSLHMREPGDWYVSAPGRAIGGDGFLRSSTGNGRSPEEAVLDDWNTVVSNLAETSYIVVRISDVERKVRWNGYMWVDVRT